uniref:G-protein coupled receptors family 1 profile domain-containing protein n=1 Tax=Trichuris muris TaxID=70415 RepID=A0A5S6QGM6_TRIMR
MCNLFIFCVILKVKCYRSDIIMAAALAISNSIVCIGFIASGSFRLKQMFKPVYNELMTPQLCFRSSIHVLCWDYGNKLSSTLILLIAIERFITMLRQRPKPSGYNSYIFIIVTLIFVLNSICNAVIVLASLWGNRKQTIISKFCIHEQVIPEGCYFFEKFYILIADTMSAIVYFSAIGCLRRHQLSDYPSVRIVQEAREKMINQKFKSLIFCQLFLNVIPVIILIVLKMVRRGITVTDIIWLMQPTNCTLQLVLFALSTAQLRDAIKGMAVKIVKVCHYVRCTAISELKNIKLVQNRTAGTES